MEQNYMRVAQQGWQCPLCLKIYGPMVQECYHCNNRETTLTSITFPEAPEGVTKPTKSYKNPYEVHFASVEVNNGK